MKTSLHHSKPTRPEFGSRAANINDMDLLTIQGAQAWMKMQVGALIDPETIKGGRDIIYMATNTQRVIL